MSSSTTSPQGGNQVFVSFRGVDVRSNFISHLYNWLDEEGFSHFDDEEPEDAGKMIKDKIFPAIDRARVAIIVLSTHYANSKWCLRELVEIVNCKKTRNLVVIPVFYGVDSADVKNVTIESKFGEAIVKSKFGEAFEKFCEEEKNDRQKKKWREAFEAIKEIAGFESKNFKKESDLLDAIVCSLRKNIWPARSLHFAEKAIGADRLAYDVISLLKISQEDVRMIGISGTEGIGKTTVAKAVCRGTVEKFECLIFLDEVGKAKRYDFRKLQKKILQNLLGVKRQMRYDTLDGNITQIKSNLHCQKILLVLDGVSNKEQIKYLGVEDRESFHLGSRILITTRDQNLLKDLKVDDKYIVEGLNQDEACELFCRHAFKSEESKKGHGNLSRYLAHYAGGHPLALIKWGSFLNEKSKQDWQTYSKDLLKNPDINSIGAVSGRIFIEYPFKVVGPCGGHRGTDTWKDEGYTDVREIDVRFNSEAIKRISILYDRYGYECNRVTHGTEGGEKSTIKLKYPNEYLTSISGYTKEVSGGTILQSLTFHTNRGKSASIGTKNGGSKFSFPYTGGKIVGFHGSCDGCHLESIGAFYEPIPHTYPVIDIGPYGGAGKMASAVRWDLGQCIDIRGIFVHYGSFIHSITFDFFDASGSKQSISHGGRDGKNTFEIKLEDADEYITAFSGHFAACHGRELISSLTFRTNKRILGPIGRERGKLFSSPSEAVKIIGFFGRSSDYLENIGAHVELYSNRLYPFKSVGLFGSPKESTWNDGNEHTNVREILVEIEPGDGKFIRSITFRYEKNGTMYLSERHGGVKGNDINPIKIDDSNEYLTSMSGYYKDGGITSLMFGTNKRTLKFIGCEEGMRFSSPVTGGKIIGFFGRSVENLEAIGAYFEPISHPHQIKSIGPFGGPGGSPWGPWQFGRGDEIEVIFDHGIRDIRFSLNGKSQKVLDWRGQRTRGKEPDVKRDTMNFSRDHLISISGYIQEQEEGDIIQSLSFHTNRKKHGPFGKEMGKFFWYPLTGSRIISFYGTHGKTLNSIGVHAQPIPLLHPFETVEPFEGSGGSPWDDGVHTDVRGFRISFDDKIKAIGIAYDNNGSFVSGSEHGSGYDNKGSFILGLTPGNKATNKYEEVLLDYPKERLLSMCVWVDNVRSTGETIVHDLKIFTTKKSQTYGPFIKEPLAKRKVLTKFYIPSRENGDRRIVGFFGRAGTHLNSIGARWEPLD